MRPSVFFRFGPLPIPFIFNIGVIVQRTSFDGVDLGSSSSFFFLLWPGAGRASVCKVSLLVAQVTSAGLSFLSLHWAAITVIAILRIQLISATTGLVESLGSRS